jgi:nitrogenase molybdenum-iron protein alpha/beta subunit
VENTECDRFALFNGSYLQLLDCVTLKMAPVHLGTLNGQDKQFRPALVHLFRSVWIYDPQRGYTEAIVSELYILVV